MLSLENKQWKPFKIDTLFEVDKGIYLKQNLIIQGNIPYITAKAISNGLNEFIGNRTLFNKNSITVEKVKLTAFYQPKDYYCSHDVSVLKNEFLNKENSLFICSMINRQGYKYSYGRQAQMNVIKRETLFCPINENNEPDYEYMEEYTKSIIDKKVEEYKKYIQNVLAGLEYKEIEPLEKKEWKEFKFIDIFNIKSGFYNKKPDLEKEGNIPFIGAVDNSNGITEFYTLKNIENSSKTGDKNNHSIDKKIFEKNAICVTNDGSVGYAYYQQSDFTCTHSVNPLYLKKYLLNKNLAMFLITCIEKQRVCFEYSRKWRPKRMIKSNILLPVNENNEPDYEYMEQYSKNLMYKKIKQYLNYKNKEA